MKRILLLLIFAVWLFAACSSGSQTVANVPVVIDSGLASGAGQASDPAAAGLASQELLLTSTPEPYPLATAASEADGSAFAEAPATLLVEPYPGQGATRGPLPTTQPPATGEATLTPEAAATPTPEDSRPVTYSYRVVNEYPHDRASYTQGLLVDLDPGILLEGSGLWGESTLRRVELETGTVVQTVFLADQYFGEGITAVGDRIFQLTWKSGVGFVYDRDSFELLGEFTYDHEGWGITHDDQRLIVSDGTATIHFWDLDTLEPLGQIQVYDEFGPVSELNELEYVDGQIFANVYQTDTIVRIQPETGQVLGKIDLSGLLPAEDRIGTEDVLNGIAYDSQSGRLYVTGKRWPKLFEIELVETTDGG